MAGKNTYNEAQPRPRIFLPPACGTRHKNTQQYLCSVENVLDQRGLAPKKSRLEAHGFVQSMQQFGSLAI